MTPQDQDDDSVGTDSEAEGDHDGDATPVNDTESRYGPDESPA